MKTSPVFAFEEPEHSKHDMRNIEPSRRCPAAPIVIRNGDFCFKARQARCFAATSTIPTQVSPGYGYPKSKGRTLCLYLMTSPAGMGMGRSTVPPWIHHRAPMRSKNLSSILEMKFGNDE